MGSNPYRLWQAWQQMKYPSSGLPELEGDRYVLIQIDGSVGPIFERTFSRGPRRKTISAESRRILERCQRKLRDMLPMLAGDG